ncbi:carbonic anhydrase [Halobacteriales archaeon QS_3_64_16]|nr:MAG: carbonic anhydrase [Halobacteriales archaeon QS_3_64_16]
MGYGPEAVAAAGDADRSARSSSAESVEDSESTLASDSGLDGLLERNRIWSSLLPEGYFEDVQESQAPTAVSMCCSDSRVSQEGMFLAPLEAAYLFKPSNIGNKVTTTVDGERVVDGSFLYALENLGVSPAVVVGHTGCGAITAAYEIATGTDVEAPPGISQELEPLVEIVEEALARDAIDTAAEESAVINQLVEYNVDAQIEFLRESEEVADETELYGFVYDFQRAYSDVAGRTVVVNIDGETDPAALRETVPENYEPFVESLLR